jgi:hypothetical protein
VPLAHGLNIVKKSRELPAVDLANLEPAIVGFFIEIDVDDGASCGMIVNGGDKKDGVFLASTERLQIRSGSLRGVGGYRRA